MTPQGRVLVPTFLELNCLLKALCWLRPIRRGALEPQRAAMRLSHRGQADKAVPVGVVAHAAVGRGALGRRIAAPHGS